MTESVSKYLFCSDLPLLPEAVLLAHSEVLSIFRCLCVSQFVACTCREQLLRILRVSLESILQSFLLTYNVGEGVLAPWFRLAKGLSIFSPKNQLLALSVSLFSCCVFHLFLL